MASLCQEPGGWNRFAIEVADLSAFVETLRGAGARFRNDIVTGVGGKQILVEDPSGNPIELFEPVISGGSSLRANPTEAIQLKPVGQAGRWRAGACEFTH